jgi:hypothetical protein
MSPNELLYMSYRSRKMSGFDGNPYRAAYSLTPQRDTSEQSSHGSADCILPLSGRRSLYTSCSRGTLIPVRKIFELS